MANDGATQLYAVALRVARLASDGTTPAGAGNMYVTNGVVRLGITPDREAGTEVTKKDGQGRICFTQRTKDVLKRANVTLEICSFDPDLTELLSGGAVIVDGVPATIGYAWEAIGTDPVPNGVSLELWTKRFVNNAFVGYARWALPRVYLWKSDRNLGADAQDNVFDGYAEENASWGNGPNNDWTSSSTRVAQWIQSATVPTGATGYQATPTQV
jgi:hypothetical protein